jgi:hypothetical protein
VPAAVTATRRNGPQPGLESAGASRKGELSSRGTIADDGDSISTRQRSFLGHCRAMPTNRRFPPPWSIEDTSAAFVVKDGGRRRAKARFVYYEEEPGRQFVGAG